MASSEAQHATAYNGGSWQLLSLPAIMQARDQDFRIYTISKSIRSLNLLCVTRPATSTADSNRFEHGILTIHAGVPSFFGLGLEDGDVPTTWPLPYGLKASNTGGPGYL